MFISYYNYSELSMICVVDVVIYRVISYPMDKFINWGQVIGN